MKNKIIIISSPSGAGKTTICKKLLTKIKNIEISVSYTTRPKRKNEKNTKDYFFTDNKDFLKLKKKNYFIETAKVFDYFYGTPKLNITNAFKRNNHLLFDIDWQGAKSLRKILNRNIIIDFFILPPNKAELRKRLEKRGRDNKNEIEKRLSKAYLEISHYSEYKHVLVNNKIDETVKNIYQIIDKYNIY
tara:strand:- start:1769 stop:2335 length:567 start_codon:yes stop_codon:yes gene_type:complete